MKVFILDSNLVFSTALSLSNPIGKFIMSASERQIEFYAPQYLKLEIERHLPKLIELSKLTEVEVRRIIELIYTQIKFVEDDDVPVEYYIKSLPYIRDVDMDDIAFVALNEYLDCLLWTGDTKLYNGLRSKGYTKVVNFQDLKKMFDLK